MSDDYFNVESTSLTIQHRGALAIYAGEKSRRNPDGTISIFMRAPLLVLPPDMFTDGEAVLDRICKLLNDNAHLFFDSAKAPEAAPVTEARA